LLLHFWPLASLVYVPRFVDRDGNSHIGRRDKEDKSIHFCLAVPDVADLRRFREEYPKVLSCLSPEVAVFRPKESLIDLPAEGGISFIEHLARLTPQIAGMAETRRSVSGIEYFHLNKDGNIVRSLSTGRIAYSSYLAEDYLAIVGRAGEKPPYANPLFRRGLMLALLENQSWFKPFGKMFAEWDRSFFVPTDHPPNLSWFWADARKKLEEVIQAMSAAPHPNDSPTDADGVLMMLIHRLTRTYLAERAKKKSGIDPEKFKDDDKINWDKLPKDYYDARRAAGESLFLEFRSRRDQAFIDHFAQTFFATKQYVSEDHCTEIGHALLRRPEDVKVLTLMALSANS
jgi:CRISPR-associated protein Cmx8